jgi:hypothetical protein
MRVVGGMVTCWLISNTTVVALVITSFSRTCPVRGAPESIGELHRIFGAGEVDHRSDHGNCAVVRRWRPIALCQRFAKLRDNEERAIRPAV